MDRSPSWPLFVFSILACLSPIFLLAKEVDGDEFAKSGLGMATVAAVVAIVQVWNRLHSKKEG